jgi:hypothetical protein
MKCLKNKVVPLIAAVTYFSLSVALYAQGTLSETVTTMELQQELTNSEATPPAASPAAEANNADQQQTIARFEKVAQKLFYSLQTGRFDQADFSAIWSANLPADANFSDSINALIRPVLAQFGRAEKLGEGKILEPHKATFLLRFSGGILDMTIRLDEQNKVVEWLLTPRTTQAAAPASPVMREQPATPAETQVISPALPEDTNTPDVPDINDFNSFQREINRMNIETRSEEQMWLGQLERKAELARAIDELVDAELRFIRKLAESEDANQTVRAIDLVLRQRRERLNNLTRQLTDELREERQQQTTERRPRRTTRSAEGQDQTERTRERPTRRTRETPAEEP